MYLKLEKDNFKNYLLNIILEQNDYSHFRKDNIEIFVYGYPYVDHFPALNNKAEWASARVVFDLYINYGKYFCSYLDGVYSIIILDNKENKYYVMTDRYGIYSLFYGKDENELVISDSIKNIMKSFSNSKLNKKCITEMLTFAYGTKMSDHTHIKDIFEFEGAKIYTVNSDLNIIEERYWNYPSNSEKIDKEAFLKIYNTHINNILRLEKNLMLTLTGGVDTRTILSSILNSKKDNEILCFTFGDEKSQDIKISKKIIRKFNLFLYTNLLNHYTQKNIPWSLEANINDFNGLIPTIHYLPFGNLFFKASGGYNTLILGILGNEIWREDKPSFPKDELLSVFKNSAEKIIIGSFDNAWEKYGGSNSIFDLLDYQDIMHYNFFAQNWSGNLIKNLGKNYKIFLGMISREILEGLAKLSHKDRQEIQKYIIRKNNKVLSKISYCKKNRILTFINKVFQKIFNKKLFKKIPNQAHYYGVWLRKYHKDFVLETLNLDYMRLRDFFKEKEFNELVTRFLNGDDLILVFILSLISLEVWLKENMR